MNTTHEPMDMHDNNTINWFPNQVSITLHSDLDISEGSKAIIASLKLDVLNQSLNEHGFNLKSFGNEDLPHPRLAEESEEEEARESLLEKAGEGIEALGKVIEALGDKIERLGDEIRDHAKKAHGNGSDEGNNEDDGDEKLNSPRGKYLFPAVDGSGTRVIAFFHLERTRPLQPGEEPDATRAVVNLLNSDPQFTDGPVPINAAAPNWVGGGTPRQPHGCPVTPPMPLPTDTSWSSRPGYWPIAVPQLSDDMQQQWHGDGVTVLVLDTTPKHEDIVSAAKSAGSSNLLLHDMVGEPAFNGVPPSILIKDQALPANLDKPGPDQLATGKDIHGNVVGFRMPDHGLFVAGIVRDLAPGASIECIRMLNDFAVGSMSVLIDTLGRILGRMLKKDPQTGKEGNLYNKPVVINMSLVITPGQDLLNMLGFAPGTLDKVLFGLEDLIKGLSRLGAVMVASTGNDSNSPMAQGHISARYPAAYSPFVIAVGSVTKNDTAAFYSNLPGPTGIATYGGNVPTAVYPADSVSPLPPVAPPPTNCMTGATDIDALVGVYSSPRYPRLSASTPMDCQAEYAAPQPDPAWAYWSGTSFSTPIISAVAARVLQGFGIQNSQQVLNIITSTALQPGTILLHDPQLDTSVLHAQQCQTTEPEVFETGQGQAAVSN